MATKKIYHDLDLGTVSQLAGARLENVTSTDLTTLAGTLGVANRGYMVYNTTDSSIYTWNGTAFDQFAIEIAGDISFQGIINPTSSSTVTPTAGHQYVVDTAGALSTQGGAITYTPSGNVEVGDVVLFTSTTTASVMERNLEQATETTLGTVSIASQAEADAGTNDTDAVTPLKLHGYVDPEFTADRARLTANEADIATLQTDLATEITRATTAEATNAANIATNATNITALDTFTGIGTALGTTATDLAGAVNELHGEINSNDTDISALQTFAGTGTALDTTATTLAGAINELHTEIGSNDTDIASLNTYTGNGTALNTTATDLAAAINEVHGEVDAEVTARAAADTTLQNNIDAEAVTRAAADTALDGRVTTLEARDEVYTYTASVDLVADTALTVSHSLSLANQDAFVFNAMHGNAMISVQVESVDANSIEVTSAVGLTGVRVTVIGV